MRHLVLVGFMGAGKTSVGRLVSARLGLPFLDTDARIEAGSGMTIPQIFERRGEAAFRDLESAAIRDACEGPAAVISVGGGALIRPENTEALRRCGVLIHLHADARTILARTGSRNDRPLLAGAADPLARIEELLEARREIYAQADARVETTGRTLEEAATAAIREWERWGGKDER
jgi:shikimate kinase